MARDYGHDISGQPGLRTIPILLTNLEIAKLTSTTPDKVRQVLNNLLAEGRLQFADNKLLLRF